MSGSTGEAFDSSGDYPDWYATLTMRHNDVFGNTPFDDVDREDRTGHQSSLTVDPGLEDRAAGDDHQATGTPCRARSRMAGNASCGYHWRGDRP